MHCELSSLSSTGCSSSSSSYEDEIPLTLSPTQLLSLAIKKRRMLYEDKEHDFRRVLGNTGMISSLCKYLGEGRAKRRRSGRSRRRGHQALKRQWQPQQEPTTTSELLTNDGNSGEDCCPSNAPQIVPCNSEQVIQTDDPHRIEVLTPEWKRLKHEQDQCRRQEKNMKMVEEDPLGDLFANVDAASYEKSLHVIDNGPTTHCSLSFNNSDEQYMWLY